jgi:acyl-CoA synthetase (AMP-forming)/AMP-acid ligase II
MAWSFRAVLAATRAVLDPAAPALAHGADVLDWATFGARADAVAAGCVAAGLTPGDKLAHHLRNSPAYITTSAAGWIAGLTHVRERLAGYKAPRRIVFVDKVPRAPNGKADYAGARSLAAAS